MKQQTVLAIAFYLWVAILALLLCLVFSGCASAQLGICTTYRFDTTVHRRPVDTVKHKHDFKSREHYDGQPFISKVCVVCLWHFSISDVKVISLCKDPFEEALQKIKRRDR